MLDNQNLTQEELEAIKAAENAVVEYDPNADFYAAPPPPPAGPYLVTVQLGKKGVGIPKKSAKTGQWHFSTDLVIKFDSGQNGFASVSSYVMRGSSELHTLLAAIGAPAPASLNINQLREHVDASLKDGTKVAIEWDWEASVDTGDPDPKKKYKVLKAGMDNFPKSDTAESGHNHIIQHEGKDVAARGIVKKWIVQR